MTTHNSLGAQLRDDGTAAVIDNAPTDYRAAVLDALDALIASGEVFTADDVRARVPERLVGPHHPNLLPAILGSRARHGLIRPVTRYRSSRATRHASRNTVWEGVVR